MIKQTNEQKTNKRKIKLIKKERKKVGRLSTNQKVFLADPAPSVSTNQMVFLVDSAPSVTGCY